MSGLKDMLREMEAIVIENERLKNVKQKYVEMAAEARELADNALGLSNKLKDLSNRLDPVFKEIQKNSPTGSKTKKSRADYDRIVRECIEFLAKGGQISRSLICNKYPELNGQPYVLFDKLHSVLPKLQERVNGRSRTLYMQDSHDEPIVTPLDRAEKLMQQHAQTD